ncbi:MAG: HAMP domain-containing sensor histidine kinase [Proteobacteria bacterium]|nr:HAMP domain-containing sensor histidine kinase [Pseudomonadota bacterium]
MHSIRSRLNIIFLAIVTLFLATSGVISYWQTQQELENNIRLSAMALQKRLQTVLPGILWNFDSTQLGLVVEAEMQSADLALLLVYNNEEQVDGRINDQGKMIEVHKSITPPDAQTFPIYYPANEVSKPMGKVVYVFSREKIAARLQQIVIAKIIEVVLLDLLLFMALSHSLLLVVIRPLGQLREALIHAADAKEFNFNDIKLAQTRKDEFADVADAVHSIAQRLCDDLESRKAAELAMRLTRDLTESAFKQLNETKNNLVQAEKMASLGGLVAGVAHEVNTPVGVILTSASVLFEDTQVFKASLDAGAIKKSEVMRYSEMAVESSRLILANAERAAQLIQSFKQVAVDQTSEARRTFELGEYIDEVIMSLKPTLKRTFVQIETSCTEKIDLDGYPGAISQIITNFLTNALAHAFSEGQEGLITLHASRIDNSVTMRFEDNGAGIPAEHLKKIFDPFFTTKRGSGGSGLGLNVVFNLVTQTLGGTLIVNSEEGKGTCFIACFPLIAPLPKEGKPS